MIPELGHFALIVALCLALVQGVFPLLGAARGEPAWLALARPAAYGQFVFLSLAFAALLGGRLDATWARWSRPWATAAWCFLTLGIALGSWWAYYELGWGGWWFWDPVENASFMPWLVGTALIHSLAATEKRGVFKSWTGWKQDSPSRLWSQLRYAALGGLTVGAAALPACVPSRVQTTGPARVRYGSIEVPSWRQFCGRKNRFIGFRPCR